MRVGTSDVAVNVIMTGATTGAEVPTADTVDDASAAGGDAADADNDNAGADETADARSRDMAGPVEDIDMEGTDT